LSLRLLARSRLSAKSMHVDEEATTVRTPSSHLHWAKGPTQNKIKLFVIVVSQETEALASRG
jgi:hypothetical protein